MSAPRRGASTAASHSDIEPCDPAGVVSSDPQTGGVVGAQPPANSSHPAGMPPLPKDAVAKITAVAEAGREIRRIRTDALKNMKGGLRALYRTLELPGTNPLKTAHAALDAAVLAAYGFSPKRDLLAQLLELNQHVAAKIEKEVPVTAPGQGVFTKGD